MYIAKNNDLIILARNTKEELEEALQLMVYTSIEETDIEYVFYNGSYLTKEEMDVLERERINKLSMTAADVERAIYKAKGMDFDDIVAMVTQLQPEGLDIKALKIELKANNFYRGNPYVNAVGKLLGFTEEQLDYFFEHKTFPEQETEVVND